MIRNESCGCERCDSYGITLKRHFNNSFYRFQDDIREYQSIAVAMQSSATREEMMTCLHSWFTRNMCCIVNADCFRTDRNYFLESEHGGEYRVLYDSMKLSDYPDAFALQDVIPELAERMASGYPLIFNSLDFMGRSFGYVCYMFENYDIIDYSKTSSLTDTVNSGLGGYINMQYQRYLMGRLEETYRTDALTGLYNRLAAQKDFDGILKDPGKQGGRLSVIMADLDGLKKINDTLGHSAGDRAIAAVADALLHSCPEGSLCVRYGGDEMLAFILGDCDCQAVIDEIARRLKEKSGECGFTVSASCGFHETILTPDLNIDAVIREADEKMYQDKASRR